MGALNNPQVGKFINENCVASFQKVATFRIVGGVGGNKQGGNVASYFLAPDGRVLHVVPGPVNAATMCSTRPSGAQKYEATLPPCFCPPLTIRNVATFWNEETKCSLRYLPTS